MTENINIPNKDGLLVSGQWLYIIATVGFGGIFTALMFCAKNYTNLLLTVIISFSFFQLVSLVLWGIAYILREREM